MAVYGCIWPYMPEAKLVFVVWFTKHASKGTGKSVVLDRVTTNEASH